MSENCTTPGCDKESRLWYRDHLGIRRGWCSEHGDALKGVRECIEAALEQISGLQKVLHCLAHTNGPEECFCKTIERVASEQGVLLVQLIKRERELTGAAKPEEKRG